MEWGTISNLDELNIKSGHFYLGIKRTFLFSSNMENEKIKKPCIFILLWGIPPLVLKILQNELP